MDILFQLLPNEINIYYHCNLRPSRLPLITKVDHYSLGFGKHAQHIDAVLPSDPALLAATKRRVLKDDTNAVDTHHSAIEVGGHSHGLVDILGEDSCHKTVLGVVGSSNNLFFRLEAVED